MPLPEPDAAVVARVKTLAATASRPTVSDADVKLSIQAHPRVDKDGIPADQVGWTPTWDVYATVSELWGIKAGKVAGDFNFSADGGNFSKGDVMAQCLEMEAKYAAMVGGSVSTLGELDELKGVIVNG